MFSLSFLPLSLSLTLFSPPTFLSLSLSFWLPDSLGSLFPNPMSFSAFAYQMGYRETHTHTERGKKSEVQPASSSTERQYIEEDTCMYVPSEELKKYA